MGTAVHETTAPFCHAAADSRHGVCLLVVVGGAGRSAYVLQVKGTCAGRYMGRRAEVLQLAGR